MATTCHNLDFLKAGVPRPTTAGDRETLDPPSKDLLAKYVAQMGEPQLGAVERRGGWALIPYNRPINVVVEEESLYMYIYIYIYVNIYTKFKSNILYCI